MTMTSSPSTISIRMANFLDALQGVEFLLGADAVGVERIEVAEDELDGLGQSARRLAFPDFPESTAADRFDQAVSGNRFRVRLPQPAHRHNPVR
jgi:hypothetical protein